MQNVTPKSTSKPRVAAVVEETEKTKRYGAAVRSLIFETYGRLGGEGTKVTAGRGDGGGGERAVQPTRCWTMEDPAGASAAVCSGGCLLAGTGVQRRACTVCVHVCNMPCVLLFFVQRVLCVIVKRFPVETRWFNTTYGSASTLRHTFVGVFDVHLGLLQLFWLLGTQRAVRPKTRRVYDHATEMLAVWARTKCRRMRNAEGSDGVLGDFIEDCYFRGNHLHVEARVSAALMHRPPKFGRFGAQKLPRTWRKGRRILRLQSPRRFAPCSTGLQLRQVDRTLENVRTRAGIGRHRLPGDAPRPSERLCARLRASDKSVIGYESRASVVFEWRKLTDEQSRVCSRCEAQCRGFCVRPKFQSSLARSFGAFQKPVLCGHLRRLKVCDAPHLAARICCPTLRASTQAS